MYCLLILHQAQTLRIFGRASIKLESSGRTIVPEGRHATRGVDVGRQQTDQHNNELFVACTAHTVCASWAGCATPVSTARTTVDVDGREQAPVRSMMRAWSADGSVGADHQIRMRDAEGVVRRPYDGPSLQAADTVGGQC